MISLDTLGRLPDTPRDEASHRTGWLVTATLLGESAEPHAWASPHSVPASAPVRDGSAKSILRQGPMAGTRPPQEPGQRRPGEAVVGQRSPIRSSQGRQAPSGINDRWRAESRFTDSSRTLGRLVR